MTARGLYYGLNVDDLKSAEQWLGGKVDMIAQQTGRASWADWLGSIGWQAWLVKELSHEVRWSIPMFANDGSLADAAAHRYDSHYVEAARTLVAQYGRDKPIIVRFGEEFNGDWMPWAAGGKEADFAQTFRNMVDAFRSVSANFRFEWNVNIGETKANVEAAYPGDAYVDYIGMDFYWDSTQSWSIKDPVQAFNYFRDTKYGLQWLEDFAQAHGKQTAYSEWGVNSPNASRYIELVKQWFDTHDPAYEIYWNSDADFQGKITDGRFGAASETYRQLFGAQAAQPTVVDGTNGNDTLTATARGSMIDGRGGNDTLIGGAGNDTMTGGAGADTFRFAPGGGQDVITDFGANGDADTIDLSAFLKTGAKPVLTNAGTDVLIAFATGETIRLRDTQAESLVATATGFRTGTDITSAVDRVLAANQKNLTLVGAAANGTGNASDNVLTGSAAGAKLYGLGGNDTFVTRGGKNVVDGGSGTDTLVLRGRIDDWQVRQEGGSWRVVGLDENTLATAVERVMVDGRTLSWTEFSNAANLDILRFIASSKATIAKYGTNVEAARAEFEAQGGAAAKGSAGFDPLLYAASNAQIARTLGADAVALTLDYIKSGAAKNLRTTGFDAAEYAAANPGVVRTIGTDPDALVRHYVEVGAKAGLSVSGFNPVTYLLANTQLSDAGVTVATARDHWLTKGIAEGLSATGAFGTEQKVFSVALFSKAFDTLGTEGDRDWYAVKLEKGVTYNIALQGAGSSLGTLGDGVLKIYDGAGRLVASDDDSGSGRDALVKFKPPTSDTYYAVIEAKDGGKGSYVLELTYLPMLFDDGSHVITGTKAGEIVVGSRFDDILTGGGGNDRFQFGVGSGHDTVTDFNKGDSIDILAYLNAGLKPTVTKVGGDSLISFTTGDTIKVLGIDPASLSLVWGGFVHA